MIPSVGKQKIAYCDHSEIQFESLDFYINLAKKIIAKMGPTFFSGLSKHMLKNEDAISFVANAIMMGDWRWKKDNKTDDTKVYKNLYSYRNQCGIWAIKTYVTKQYKQKNNKRKINTQYSLNYVDDNDISLESAIADHDQKEPLEVILEKEKVDNLVQSLEDLFNSGVLSDKQKKQIIMYYYENMTLEQIGNKYNVTREAIRQSIKSGISKIKSILN
jgi:RNA polymerase sigma factor (sigma-70 family)